MTSFATGAGALAPTGCWCCGQPAAAEAMVRLSNHPEVTLCTSCAYFVAARAWELEDAQRLPRPARIRVRATRWVIERGLDQKALIGRPLRWISTMGG